MSGLGNECFFFFFTWKKLSLSWKCDLYISVTLYSASIQPLEACRLTITSKSNNNVTHSHTINCIFCITDFRVKNIICLQDFNTSTPLAMSQFKFDSDINNLVRLDGPIGGPAMRWQRKASETSMCNNASVNKSMNKSLNKSLGNISPMKTSNQSFSSKTPSKSKTPNGKRSKTPGTLLTQNLQDQDLYSTCFLIFSFFLSKSQTHKAWMPLQGVGYNYFILEANAAYP